MEPYTVSPSKVMLYVTASVGLAWMLLRGWEAGTILVASAVTTLSLRQAEQAPRSEPDLGVLPVRGRWRLLFLLGCLWLTVFGVVWVSLPGQQP
jgi:hypothetical protein